VLYHHNCVSKVLSYLLLTSGVGHSIVFELTDCRQSGVTFSSHGFGHALVFYEWSVKPQVVSRCCA
jgi:hypothetical protein